MSGLEFLKVESTENGGDRYELIATAVLQDHNLLSIVEGLYLYIDPQKPLFVAAGIIRPPRSAITVSDVGNVLTEEKTKATIAVGSETYLAPMLKMLWTRLGHDHVDQPDRFTVLIDGVDIPEDIAKWVVIDPSESLFKDLIYAIQVIAPEGFKVRRENYGQNRFSYAASENTVSEKEADEIISRCFREIEEGLK